MADIGIYGTVSLSLITCTIHVFFAETLKKNGVQDVFVLCTEAELRR